MFSFLAAFDWRHWSRRAASISLILLMVLQEFFQVSFRVPVPPPAPALISIFHPTWHHPWSSEGTVSTAQTRGSEAVQLCLSGLCPTAAFLVLMQFVPCAHLSPFTARTHHAAVNLEESPALLVQL